jgi:ATP-dependent DNA helicase
MVYRLVTANTIDEKIVERAAAKRKLEKIIIHSKKFKKQDSDGVKKTMEAISPLELLELLSSNDHAGTLR